MELEAIYVLGDFGISAHRLGFENRFNGQVFDRYAPYPSIGKLPVSVNAVPSKDGLALDLTAHGLPFYAGRPKISQKVVLPADKTSAYLEFDNLRAALAVVWVNGKRIGTCAWQPHQVDLGDCLHSGENLLEIELVPSARNLLGPLHRKGGDTESTGSGHFNDKPTWTDDLILVPLGFDGVTVKMTR